MTKNADVVNHGSAVIYAVGIPGRPGTLVPALRLHVAFEGWALVDICFDRDNTVHPTKRPGLCMALDRVHLGFAAVLVLSQPVYVSMPEPEWLAAAVRTSGGFIRPVTAADREPVVPQRQNVGAGLQLGACVSDGMPRLREAG